MYGEDRVLVYNKALFNSPGTILAHPNRLDF